MVEDAERCACGAHYTEPHRADCMVVARARKLVADADAREREARSKTAYGMIEQLGLVPIFKGRKRINASDDPVWIIEDSTGYFIAETADEKVSKLIVTALEEVVAHAMERS